MKILGYFLQSLPCIQPLNSHFYVFLVISLNEIYHSDCSIFNADRLFHVHNRQIHGLKAFKKVNGTGSPDRHSPCFILRSSAAENSFSFSSARSAETKPLSINSRTPFPASRGTVRHAYHKYCLTRRNPSRPRRPDRRSSCWHSFQSTSCRA